MRVRFVESLKVVQPDGNGPEYLKGSVYDFTGFVAETYGRKYVRRGYAVEVEAPAEAVMLPAVVAPEAVTPSPLPQAAPESIPNASGNVTTWTKQRGRNRSSR